MKLQTCFYAIFDPVVLSSTEHITGLATLPPAHKKLLPKFSKTFLLDKFELNAKSRCLFAWTG